MLQLKLVPLYSRAVNHFFLILFLPKTIKGLIQRSQGNLHLFKGFFFPLIQPVVNNKRHLHQVYNGNKEYAASCSAPRLYLLQLPRWTTEDSEHAEFHPEFNQNQHGATLTPKPRCARSHPKSHPNAHQGWANMWHLGEVSVRAAAGWKWFVAALIARGYHTLNLFPKYWNYCQAWDPFLHTQGWLS